MQLRYYIEEIECRAEAEDFLVDDNLTHEQIMEAAIQHFTEGWPEERIEGIQTFVVILPDDSEIRAKVDTKIIYKHKVTMLNEA